MDKSNQPMQGIKQNMAPRLSIIAVGLLVLSTTANSSMHSTKWKTPMLLVKAKQLAKRLSLGERVKHKQESQDTASEHITEAINMYKNTKLQDTSEVSDLIMDLTLMIL